jgi:hypothetical protein
MPSSSTAKNSPSVIAISSLYFPGWRQPAMGYAAKGQVRSSRIRLNVQWHSCSRKQSFRTDFLIKAASAGDATDTLTLNAAPFLQPDLSVSRLKRSRVRGALCLRGPFVSVIDD